MSEDIHRIDRTEFEPIRIKPNYEQPGHPPKKREPGNRSKGTRQDDVTFGFEPSGEGTASKQHSLDIEA